MVKQGHILKQFKDFKDFKFKDFSTLKRNVGSF